MASGEVEKIVDLVYPVGSIYMSVNGTDPGTLFGGTWERLEDRFLLGAGTDYAAGTTGGEAAHSLSVAEMPTHNHDRICYTGNSGWTFGDTSGLGGNTTDAHSSQVTTNQVNNKGLAHWATSENGGGQAHNNMPPYLAVYMWKRTA